MFSSSCVRYFSIVGTLSLSASLISAHAILLRSLPSPNQVLKGSSVPVELHFNSRVDGKRSRLTISDASGTAHELVVEQPSRDSIVSHAVDLPPGRHILSWQILAEDGHITRGAVEFFTQ